MARAKEYPRITRTKNGDVLLVDGNDGVRTILVQDVIQTILDLGLASIDTVAAVPQDFDNNMIYVIPGDPSATPPTRDTFYITSNDTAYKIQTGGEEIDYDTEIIHRPKINRITLEGDKTGTELGLAEIQVVANLPATFVENTIYVVPKDLTATPKKYTDTFYIYKGGQLYRLDKIDYDTQVYNKPEIDEHILEAGDNTHEYLELISEKDFTTEFSGKTDGMEFVLPEHTPDNPIEITEIDDSPEMKYAENLTSSNFYINTQIDALKLLLDKKVQVLVVSELPDSFVNNTLYVIPGESEDGTVTPGLFYLYKGNTLYLVGGSGGEVDYELDVHNKPEIDSVELMPNQTHEDLELISEKDFVTESTNKTDGIEIILPEGTPDNPIELTEINDAPEMKYANNLTSSNLYINTALDEINRILDGKVQVLVVDELPAQVTKNTIYFVESEQEGVYNQYIVDSLGTTHLAGSTQMDLSNYVRDSRSVGSKSLKHDITPTDLANDIKNETVTFTNKTIDANSNTIRNLLLTAFAEGVVKTEMPSLDTDDQILTASAIRKAIAAALVNRVPTSRKVGSKTLAADITAANIANDIKDETVTVTNKTISASDNTISNLGVSNFAANAIRTEMPESPTDNALLTAKATKDALATKQDIITDKGLYYELTDTIYLTSIYSESGKLYRKSFQLIKLWGWLVQSCCSGTISPDSTSLALEVPTSKAVVDYVTELVKGTRATGSSAFTYNPNTNQGYTINGDYDSNCPRQISKVGRRVNLSFCCKGSAVANADNWTSLGTVPTGYRPAKKTSIIAQVYSGTKNEAAGGYVDTSGWVVIWTNAKSATNNYQVRVNACWDVE